MNVGKFKFIMDFTCTEATDQWAYPRQPNNTHHPYLMRDSVCLSIPYTRKADAEMSRVSKLDQRMGLGRSVRDNANGWTMDDWNSITARHKRVFFIGRVQAVFGARAVGKGTRSSRFMQPGCEAEHSPVI
jgi:hypothetical protein